MIKSLVEDVIVIVMLLGCFPTQGRTITHDAWKRLSIAYFSMDVKLICKTIAYNHDYFLLLFFFFFIIFLIVWNAQVFFLILLDQFSLDNRKLER